MSTHPNLIRVTSRRGKVIQTYVRDDDGWHVQAPVPGKAADTTLDLAVARHRAQPAQNADIEIAANLAISAMTRAVLDLGARLDGLDVPEEDVAKMETQAREHDSVRSQLGAARRRANGYPGDDGLIRLGDGIPAIRPAKLLPIFDGLVSQGVYEVSSDQLTGIITARR